jgi:patatin-related protein
MPDTQVNPAGFKAEDLETFKQFLTQEVRFAVVMYGGVSLAIYMKGTSQELLNAVRATAFFGKGQALRSTERVYEKIGRILYHGRDAKAEKKARSARKADWESTNPGRRITDPMKDAQERDRIQGAAANVRTRLLIDILSGTSAGGINAVFLAKALANEQDLSTVKQVWMKEGNIDTLLNDSKSDRGEYKSKSPKTSLLNSQRLLGKLLGAFNGMETRARLPVNGSRLGKEIDLFVTTTDLNGLWQPIQLTNEVILERVHKLHFHFGYRNDGVTEKNDLSRDYNTMLAFASRCTSSFPGAFEPMTFQDVDAVDPGISTSVRSKTHRFYKFFAEMDNFGRRPGIGASGINEDLMDFTQRPLADGGYLNNKPFSFALETIKTRNSTRPVRRVLLYLDPFPEEVTDAPAKKRFTFTENLLLAGSTLPRYQTIREDIERVQQHNRDLRKAKTLMEEVEQDLMDAMNQYFTEQHRTRGAEAEKQAKLGDKYTAPPKYQQKYVSEMVAELKNGYIGYHRLSVSTVSDELALLYAALFGFNVNSDEVYAIRMLVHSWRQDKFEAERKNSSKEPENMFLFRYDLGFRFRRLKYMCDEIDRLLAMCANPDAAKGRQEIVDRIKGTASQATVETINLEKASVQLNEYRQAGVAALKQLEKKREELWGVYPGQILSDETNPDVKSLREAFREKISGKENWVLGYAELRYILEPVSDDDCQKRADEVYERGKVKGAFEKTAESLSKLMSKTLTEASQRFLNALNPVGSGDAKSSAREEARANGPVDDPIALYLWKRHQYFEGRDMIVFPIMPDKLTGKTRPTEIYRIGPQDATFVYGDAQGGEARRAKKLAGTALMDFGAFLNEGWRSNDMLWGRLDGAERIIESLLPDEEDQDLREELMREATEIILKEEFTPQGGEDLERDVKGFLQKGLEEFDAGTSKVLGNDADCQTQLQMAKAERIQTVDKFLDAASVMLGKGSPKLADELVRLAKSDTERLDLFRAYYSKPAGPPLEESVGWAKRATGILGEMFRGLDETAGINTKVGGWIARAGAFGANFVQFALPDTLLHKMVWHWLGMVYLAETLLLVVGAFVYKGAGLETAGWIALLLTVALHFAASLVGRWLGMRPRPPMMLVGVLTVAILAGLGVLHFHYHWSMQDLLCPLSKLRELLVACCGKS